MPATTAEVAPDMAGTGGLNPIDATAAAGGTTLADNWTLTPSAVNAFTVGSFTSGATIFAFGCKMGGGTYNDAGTAFDPDNPAVSSADDTCGGGADAFKSLNFAISLANMATQGNNGVAVSYDNAAKMTTGATALAGFGAMFTPTNLYDAGLSGTGATNDSYTNGNTINTAFEYMSDTTFATFDAFAGATSKYVYKMPSSTDTDIAYRYKNSTPSGMNYSLNYAYAYDKNPIINMRWENAAGQELTPVPVDVNMGADGTFTTVVLKDATGTYYGGSHGRSATLVFEQETKRVHNIGGSFDLAIDNADLGPVVIRGEALYMKDTYSPVMDRNKLAYGDLVNALTMRKGDRFKYVLGADITALTNMMVSVQFIRDTNLDHIDSNVQKDGSTPCGATDVNCGVYTVDYSTMHLTNGFNKAEKNKDFYSLFLSKPFGESGQHRWNNILMLEETGGRWNRFDIEYAIDDNTVGSVEWNKYWGDNNTQFGQLKNSSNIQLGLKYTF